MDDLDLNLDEFVDQGEHRPGGQGGEPGQPHGEVRRSDGLSAKYPDDGGLFAAAAAAGDEIAAAYEACDYSRAMRLIMALADRANQYVDAKQPWKLRKDAGSRRRSCRTSARSRSICSARLSSTWRRCCRSWPSRPANC